MKPLAALRRTRPATVLAGAALAATAIAIAVFVPTEEQQLGSFVRTIPALDATVQSREFTVSVTNIQLADRLQTEEWIGMAGNGQSVWVVVDIVFASRIDRSGITGLLRIGDREFWPSTRPGFAVVDEAAASEPGLPWAGSMVFEIPESALAAPGDSAVVQFATGDTRLDGVLEYSFDLGDLDRVKNVMILEPGRVAP